MALTNLTAVITELIGEPSNDLESFLIYFVACVISLIFIFFILYLFKIVAKTIR